MGDEKEPFLNKELALLDLSFGNSKLLVLKNTSICLDSIHQHNRSPTFLKDISTWVSPLKLNLAIASPYSNTCNGDGFLG